MSNPTPSLKQRAHELVDQLPDDATWDDVIKEARFRKDVEEGIAAAESLVADIEAGLADSEADRVTPNNEVRRRFGLPALPE